MGRLTDATNESESERARWWMTVLESIAYSPSADAAIPVGAVMPGIIAARTGQGSDETTCGASDDGPQGRWTLELVRRLQTGSAYDVEIKNGVLMWVAAFDHSEKRHTHHLRPLPVAAGVSVTFRFCDSAGSNCVEGGCRQEPCHGKIHPGSCRKVNELVWVARKLGKSLNRRLRRFNCSSATPRSKARFDT